MTIMAYGQTGSGKTYTMGTSDLNAVEDPEQQGLIPRFMNDLFENLSQSIEGERLETKVKVSFLEIYGEDVFDLISATVTTGGMPSHNNAKVSNNLHDRPSLMVREDETGRVFVQGQQEVEVSTAAAALELLCQGTRNRITGSTNMNSGSSRSHAVFTISLDQTVQSSKGGVDDDVHHMTSKLTFVDLAGSERIKRTGAEGQRLKEGIQINSGLFNLGQVINALADDQRIKQGIKLGYIPYRNSKLTHLLKDALGGNSQTLFLACVSPAESNESESHSTLNYAKQARNIQNKPVKNMDKLQLELRRLKYSVKTWMIKAVAYMFNERQNRDIQNGLSPLPNVSPVAMSKSSGYSKEDEVLSRPEVIEYINMVNAAIEQKLHGPGVGPSPRKVRLSVCNPPAFLSPVNHKPFQRPLQSKVVNNDDRPIHGVAAGDSDDEGCDDNDNDLNMSAANISFADSMFGYDHNSAIAKSKKGRESVLNVMGINRESVFEAQDPEETEKLVARMLTLVNKEKEISQEAAAEVSEKDIKEIVVIDKEIEEKEAILNKLLDTVKGYAVMKSDFEKLLGAIESLENERRELEAALEKAKRNAEHDTSHSVGGGGGSSKTIEVMKERFAKVKDELQRMRDERKTKENAYKLMQRESKQVENLQKELTKLKESKINMLKQQKIQAVQFQKLKKEQQLKMSSLKKSDIKKQRQMNSLKNELVKKERVLGHKDRELGRINSKLRACEEHITQLLKIQNRNRQKIGSITKNESVDMRSGLTDSELEHLTTSKTMLDNLVADRVEKKRAKMLFHKKTSVLNDLNKELVQEAVDLEELMAKKKGLISSITAVYAAFDIDEFDVDSTQYVSSITTSDPTVDIASYVADMVDVSKNILIVENNIDRITRELDFYNADLDDLANLLDKSKDKKDDSWEELGKEIIAGISLTQFRPLIWDLLSEKANQAEQLSSAHEALRTATENVTVASDKVLELEKQLNAVKQQMKESLEKAELQRVSDMWSLIKAHNTSADGDKSPTNDVNADSSLALQVSVRRANELEKLLEASLQSEEDCKDQIAGLNKKVAKLENELTNQMLRSKVGDSNSSNSAVVGSNCIDKLVSIWDTLGVSAASRTEVVDSITNASEIASIKAVEMYETEHSQVLQQIRFSQETLELFNKVLNGSTSAQMSMSACPEDSLLLPQLEYYQNEVSRRKGEIIDKKDSVIAIKEKLLDLLAEMWIEIGDLPLSLQNLMKLSLDDVTIEDDGSVIALARQALDVNIVLTDSIVLAWNNEIKKLNILRANNTNKLVTLRSNCISLAQSLGVYDKQSLVSVIGSNGNENTTNTVINLMLSSSSANPPGASQLVTMFECTQSVLNVIKSNRVAVHDVLFKFIDHINGQIQDNVVYTVKEGFEVFSREEVADLLSHTTNINARALQAKEQLQHRLNMLSRDCKIDLAVNSKPAAEVSNIAALDELCSIAELVEEEWITKTLNSFLTLYKQQTGDHLNNVMYLRTEVGRYTVINDSIVEITRLDNLLTKHVVEMEEFEATSKQNRMALLTGNSKALVEEEKFRKNGKKKYEVLSEKIINAHVNLLKAVGTLNGMANGVVPGIDLTHLSSQTVALLKGKAQEKIELMHLHTTTHGTKRWSGDKDDVTQENPESNDGKEVSVSNAIPAIPSASSSTLPTPPTVTSTSRIAKPASKTSSNLSATIAAASNAIKATETITKAGNASGGQKNAVATSMMKNVSSLFSQRGKSQATSKDENVENKSALSNK